MKTVMTPEDESIRRDSLPRRIALSLLLAGIALLGLWLLPASSGARPTTAFALAPPVVALCLALGSRRPAASMLAATLLGAALHGGPLAALTGVWKYWLSNLFDAWHVCAMGFAISLLGLVQVMTASGGTRAVLSLAARHVGSRRGSKLGTAVAGLLVFFDDYANALMVGPTLQPLTDRHGVSRAKLAYLVDSTAAPVAGLALMSTWVAYEVGLFQDVARELSLTQGGYALLLGALPYRFYCVFALALVFLSSAWERDLPPMLAAERAALAATPDLRAEASDAAELEGPARCPWLNAVAPLSALMTAVPLGLLMDGGFAARVSADPTRLLSLAVYRDSLMASENNTVVLFCAGLVAVVVAFALPLARRDAPVANLGRAFGSGARSALPPLAILLSAWALAGVCKDVGTGSYLVWALEDALSGSLVPVASFAIAAVVAFFTGTSWGTMAIVVPTVAPLAHVAGGEGLLVVTLASVLDGAIFGDHCSPISDTTVMTCVATGCDLVDHVQTQLPYALVAMGVAGTCGYLWAAGGGALWLSYVGGFAALTVTLWVLGRPVLRDSRK